MFGNITLDKPIIFFDLETTGTNLAKDRIVEFCAIKINPDKSRETYLKRFNPGIPIEPGATSAHGITDEMVVGESVFSESVEEIVSFFDGCDVAGYNILRFDIPLFVEELIRHKASKNPIKTAKIIDSMSIYFKKESRTLADALHFYANEELISAHSAEADVEATIKVLGGQMSKYKDIGGSIKSLYDFSTEGKELIDYAGCFTRNENGDLIFTFGKNKGSKVLDNTGMLKWMLDRDFTEHTKSIIRNILEGKLK